VTEPESKVSLDPPRPVALSVILAGSCMIALALVAAAEALEKTAAVVAVTVVVAAFAVAVSTTVQSQIATPD